MKSHNPDYILDLNAHLAPGGEDLPTTASDAAGLGRARPFVRILFSCCNAYQRIYRNRHASAYEGHCPRCARPVRLRIGPNGTDARFFIAD